MGEFDYLKRFVSKEEPGHPNWFTPLGESGVAEAEGRIGFRFPASLRSFYLEIGSGFCMQKAALYAALCRASGIPARIGFQDLEDYMIVG